MAFAKCFNYILGIHFKIGKESLKHYSSVPKSASIAEVLSSKGSGEVHVEGWVTAVRKMKNLLFLDLDDGSCTKRLQLTIEKDKAPSDLGYGASVRATGALQVNKNNQLEIFVNDVTIVGPCKLENGFPFAPRMPYNSNHMREFIHLRPRTLPFSSLLRVRHKAELFLNEILDKEGFCKISVPVLTTNDCEGGGEVFLVKPDSRVLIKEMASKEGQDENEVFFGEKTYLTVSGQLHLEAAARALKKVYSFGPTFRAENSRSRLHLSEFYMLETEMAFVNGIEDITKCSERFIKSLIETLLDACGEDIHNYRKLTKRESGGMETLGRLVKEPFTTLTYDEAFKILEKNRKSFKVEPRFDNSFNKEHELFLVRHNSDIPIFVVDWPEKIKPFYMKLSEGSSNKVAAMDLLCSNVGEICGGSIREDNYEILKKKIEQSNFGTRLDWYLQLREFGNVTTGGFGMGFERFIQLVLGTTNIKDTIPYPRWPHNCKL